MCRRLALTSSSSVVQLDDFMNWLSGINPSVQQIPFFSLDREDSFDRENLKAGAASSEEENDISDPIRNTSDRKFIKSPVANALREHVKKWGI
jgi:hypothetical protein